MSYPYPHSNTPPIKTQSDNRLNQAGKLTNFYSLLFSAISLSNRNCVILKRIEVYSHADGRSDLVLSPVTLTNIAVIIENCPWDSPLHLLINCLGLLHQRRF